MGDGRTFYSVGKHFCCLLCLKTGKVDPTLSVPGGDVTNASKHMRRKHAKEWEASETATAATRPVDKQKQQQLNFAKAVQQPDRMKVVQPFKLRALQQLMCAALLLTSYAYHSMTLAAMRVSLGAVSGLTTMLVPQPLSAHLLASSSALESSRVCSPPSRVCTRAALQPVFLRMNVLLL